MFVFNIIVVEKFMISQFPIYDSNYYRLNTLNTNASRTQEQKPLTKKQKGVILASSAAGVCTVLAGLAAHKGFSLNPAKIIKTPVKDWAIFKYKPKDKSIQFKAPQIISLAAGSILGGFIGGAIVDDKSNLKQKKREILSQMLGNVLVPVGCVATGAEIYTKYQDKIEGAMPQIKNKTGRAVNIINKISQKIPNAAGTLAFLGIGIYLGNKVSNFINDKLYHKKVERNIKATDFAPHVDDVCLATSMMNEDSAFGSALGRIIPLALIVPGYQVGIARKK